MTDRQVCQHIATILPDASKAQVDDLMLLLALARADELKAAIRYERRHKRGEARAARRPMSRNIARLGELYSRYA